LSVRRGKDADQESQGKPKPGLARLCRLLCGKPPIPRSGRTEPKDRIVFLFWPARPERLRRCEKIAGCRILRLRRLLCAPSRRGLGRKPPAFRQAGEPKEFNLEPEVRKGWALPHSRRPSRDFLTPSHSPLGTVVTAGVRPRRFEFLGPGADCSAQLRGDKLYDRRPVVPLHPRARGQGPY